MDDNEVLTTLPRRKRNRTDSNVERHNASNETENIGEKQHRQQEKSALHKNFKEFKKLAPPSFEGQMDPLEAEKWLEEMEMVFEVLECNDKEKVFFAVYQLKGNARDWWKAERMTHEQDITVMSWNKFKDLFYDNYFPTRTRQQKEVEFVKLEQGSMTVSKYRAKFLELAKFAGRWIGDEVGKTRKLVMGLQPRIRQIVVPFQLTTLVEWLKNHY
ncbi:uncharacterized protein LOC124924501 [Impatiens glandulifera]|uniref:uncharacterized protein LOC124924501 n=1 Tax=Impatiens glandulifera TaxID=253017 RepID=UPI001FB11822|nr:uncharacterized protein LOC124924501 [Impatiens glandulifera]